MIDSVIVSFDKALRTLCGVVYARRTMPGRNVAEGQLSKQERACAAAVMRVNHVGEVCAQALYQGQSFVCASPTIRMALTTAGDEEADHLAWTAQRIEDLGGRVSVLNPLWYGGAFGLGVLAGLQGDRWSLGFLAETERQVERHLDRCLSWLPERDAKSREVLVQMKSDEIRHAELAVDLGAVDLPSPCVSAMHYAGAFMVRVAYYL